MCFLITWIVRESLFFVLTWPKVWHVNKVSITHPAGNIKILFRPYITVTNILFLLIAVRHCACIFFIPSMAQS